MNARTKTINAIVGALVFALLLVFLASLAGCGTDKPVAPSPIIEAPASLEKIEQATGEIGTLVRGLRDDLRKIK